MPYLIDGNNLIHALMEVGPEVRRVGLCEVLAEALPAGEDVTVVFDGPHPEGGLPGELAERLEAIFTPGHPADETICARIASDSAPRRLIVVSSDREIRRAATRRRCQSVTSEDFSRELCRLLRRASQTSAERPEPPEKRSGLDEGQTDDWMRVFGLLDD